MKINNILCPVDDSISSKYALEFAQSFAGKHNASVKVIHVFDEQSLKDSTKEEIVDGIKSALHQPTLAIETTTGFIPDIVNDLSTDYDLLVMGIRGSNHTSQLYASNAAQVIQMSTCPVFLIPERQTEATFRKIAFSADFKDLKKEERFEILRDLADESDSELHILHVSSAGKELGSTEGDEAIEMLHIFEDINHAFFVIEEKDIVAGIEKHVVDKRIDLLAIMPRTTTRLSHSLTQAIIDRTQNTPIFSFHA